jgi:hypothetical protein
MTQLQAYYGARRSADDERLVAALNDNGIMKLIGHAHAGCRRR